MHKQKINAGPRGFSDNTIKTKTGRASKQWYALLDKWDAHKHGHTNTARYLEEKYKIPDWWAQALTVRYEYARHLRKPLAIPHIFRQALARNKKAQKKFADMPPSHQREYVEYIVEAKMPETKKNELSLLLKN